MNKKTRTSMLVQCHYKYNCAFRHLRMGEYRKTGGDKQACIIEFVRFQFFQQSSNE